MTVKELERELEMWAYMRTHAGKEGRGGEIYPEPTPEDDSRCTTVMSVLLLNVMDEVRITERITPFTDRDCSGKVCLG